jgi:hypothetical protein
MDVAPAPRAAGRNHQAVGVGVQIAQHLTGSVVDDQRADRDFENQVAARAAVFQAPGAGLTIGRAPGPPAPVLGEISQRAVGKQDDRAAAPTVAAVGPASRRVRLAAQRRRPRAAAPTDDGDSGGVDEATAGI